MRVKSDRWIFTSRFRGCARDLRSFARKAILERLGAFSHVCVAESSSTEVFSCKFPPDDIGIVWVTVAGERCLVTVQVTRRSPSIDEKIAAFKSALKDRLEAWFVWSDDDCWIID